MTQPTHFTPNQTIHFAQCGSWPASNYFLDEKSAYALEMALVTQRPLLVKGEPGMGKSFLARAAAAQLQRRFIAEVININTEGQDLLWRFDPVARLNDAHAGLQGDQLDLQHYLNPGVLWWAFDAATAEIQYEQCRQKVYRPQAIDTEATDNGTVLLIDEIDKAEPSLPNSLLEVLGNRGFEVPMLGKTVVGKTDQPPLVIITTNDERELPPAFLRRCLVLHLSVAEADYPAWLLQRANVHFTDQQCSVDVKQQASQQLLNDRTEAARLGMVKPGLAEYLDLLTALDGMTQAIDSAQRQQAQLDLLDSIKDFVLKKAI